MSTPTATPTCGELSCDECNARTATLETELARLRALFPAICSALGNGAFCTPDVSIGFLESIPNEVASVVARLRAELAVAENWVEHHSKHADDLIGENVKLRAEVERLKDGGVQRIKDALATALDTRDAAIARAERAEAELARLRADRDYNHEYINRLASATGTLGEKSGTVVDVALSSIDQLRAEVERLKALGSWAHTCIHHTDDERKAWVACPCCANARAEKAEDELKQMQSSALTWARFAGDKSACADLADQRARLTERLWKEFITLMDITEESDSGNAFNPNKISSCRAMDGKRLNEILIEARQIVF